MKLLAKLRAMTIPGIEEPIIAVSHAQLPTFEDQVEIEEEMFGIGAAMPQDISRLTTNSKHAATMTERPFSTVIE